MNLIRAAIGRPVTVLVGVILLVLFGLLAAVALPIQLTPDVDKPLVTVTTRWEGASPMEVEREIIDEQEEQLKSVQGVVEMNSTAVEGSGSVELEFAVGIDVNRALLDVADRLRQVPEYPETVEEPVVAAGETQGAGAIAWFILRRLPGAELPPEGIPRLRTLMEEVVKPRMERAKGVATVAVVGGVEKEVHVQVDPQRLAARGLTLLDLRAALRGQNVNTSAGTIDQGKRAYVVRAVGKFERLEELDDLVLARRDGAPVFLRDVGSVAFGYKKPESVVRSLGEPAIAINATRQSGTNVIEVMTELQTAVADANEQVLGPQGLRLVQVYDQTSYIDSAIALVFQNLWVGGTITLLVLLLFLGSLRSTLIVAVAIPISVVGSFLALGALGRNLNVVSLAGLAFAVGMVVDNSIVVLENIHRHRQSGASALEAAMKGAQEVWGAVLASTLTTLAVFIPVVFVEEEAGQLFRDIAIAISAAVFVSLLVSALFIPMASARLMAVGESKREGRGERRVRSPRLLSKVRSFGERLRDGITRIVAWINRTDLRRIVTVGGLTAAAVILAWLLLPPMSYLPGGNQNLVIGFLIPPPGYNPAEFERMALQIEDRLQPYWKDENEPPLRKELRRPDWFEGQGDLPGITQFFYVARGRSVFMGARSDDSSNVKGLIDLFQHAAGGIPGTMVFATQRSLFQRGIDSGNSIEVQISGTRMEQIQQAGLALMGKIRSDLAMPRPDPANFHLGGPEVQVRLDRARSAELGLDMRDLGFMVRCMIDGAIVSEFRDEGINIDVKIVPPSRGTRRLEEIEQIPLVTPSLRQVTLGSVADVRETSGPIDIRHIELDRAVTLVLTPPEGMELSTAMEQLENDVIPPLRDSGAIPEGVTVRLAGTADKLVATRDALKWNFLLALLITYLLLSALFEHFGYPLVILFSVPLAAVGGVLGMNWVHRATGHQMDVLTMLGFVILIGTVVNNAILIVHQALQYMRSGMGSREAIAESVRIRVRPIFMSTCTSVGGMLPLVLFPGAGSELYRGLGSVVVGGLLVSTIFTLVVVPTLFGLMVRERPPRPDRESRLQPDSTSESRPSPART